MAVAVALVGAVPATSSVASAASAPATATVTSSVAAAPTTVAPAATAPAATTPRVYQLGERVLRRRDRGKDVRALQKLLSVKRTGYFNKRTGKAVRKVERKYKLAVDTVVDARTLVAIRAYAKAKAARKARLARAGRGGSPAAAKRFARAYIADKYGWGARQMSCLVSLWNRESHWNYRASNPNGIYHGIPQTSSSVWRAQGYSRAQYKGSAAVQVKVGAKYIKGRYGTPCSAWSFWKSHHWY